MPQPDRTRRRSLRSLPWRLCLASTACLCIGAGCRSLPVAGHALPAAGTGSQSTPTRKDRERVAPPVHDALARLLARHIDGGPRLSEPAPEPSPLPPVSKRIGFVGVVTTVAGEAHAQTPLEEQVRKAILGRVGRSRAFQTVEPETFEAALHDARLGTDVPLTDEHLRPLAAALERRGMPVDYFLRATLAPGAGRHAQPRLTLELVDTSDGAADRETVELPASPDRLTRWWGQGDGIVR